MLPCKWECRKQFWRCPAANSPMWKKTILATATKLKCTWKLPSPPLLFPSISTKLSTNFLPTHQPTPRSFSSSLRRKASSESLASLLQESGMMMHFSEARERRGEEEGKLRLLWASVVVFLARKRKRRRSVREYRAHFEPSTSPSAFSFILFSGYVFQNG